jgi:hypothetical protein
MSGTEIVLECGHPDCTETFETGRSIWKDAVIEGREAGWDTESNPELCPDHKKEEEGMIMTESPKEREARLREVARSEIRSFDIPAAEDILDLYEGDVRSPREAKRVVQLIKEAQVFVEWEENGDV